VLLQAHWLLPSELDVLNNIHPDFLSRALSAVDATSNILIGRPYGGIAILYRNTFANNVRTISSHEPQLCGIQIDTNIDPMLLLCVHTCQSGILFGLP